MTFDETPVNTIAESEEEEYYIQEDDTIDEFSEDSGSPHRKLIWQAKDFSLREFQAMKQDGDLVLQPSYQRKYVMDSKRASRLVESILLDIPIPVIYLAEEMDGKYSVIDGQQRLTSFIAYMENKLPDTGKVFPLVGLKVLPELNKRHFTELEREHQNKIKTTTIHTIIIKNESHEDIKFEIFERLNTGSIELNDDEIRNTIYRGKYMDLLSELENDSAFHNIVKKKRILDNG